MARPREHTDEGLLDLVGSALARRTARSRWSLADVAGESGIAPATLVKRFGSRHGLLVALSRRWIDSIPAAPAGGDVVAELTAWVSATFSPTPGRSAAVVGMQYLMEDLSDDELAALLAQGWAKQVDYLAALLTKAGLARLGDPLTGARLLFDALNGGQPRAAAGDLHPPSALTILRAFWELWT
jgi:AcrR family transcriptional regulator